MLGQNRWIPSLYHHANSPTYQLVHWRAADTGISVELTRLAKPSWFLYPPSLIQIPNPTSKSWCILRSKLTAICASATRTYLSFHSFSSLSSESPLSHLTYHSFLAVSNPPLHFVVFIAVEMFSWYQSEHTAKKRSKESDENSTGLDTFTFIAVILFTFSQISNISNLWPTPHS